MDCMISSKVKKLKHGSLVFLVVISASSILFCSQTGQGAIEKPQVCRSTREYIETLQFLRESKELGFGEESSKKIADQVSKSCTGGAKRFADVILLLKTVGMSERKSLEMALDFSARPPDVQKNFVEIFTRAYLSEFFDYDYTRAMKLALDMSIDYKGDPKIAREDFLSLVKFCKESENLDLPLVFCTEYVEKVSKLSQFYPNGLKKNFLDLYDAFRNNDDFLLTVKASLKLTYEILEHGPLASDNFFEGFKLATKELNFTKEEALRFAVDMAVRSHTTNTPPVANAESSQE